MVWLVGILFVECKSKTGGVEEKRRGWTEECFIGRSSPQHQHDGEEVALEKQTLASGVMNHPSCLFRIAEAPKGTYSRLLPSFAPETTCAENKKRFAEEPPHSAIRQRAAKLRWPALERAEHGTGVASF